MPVNMREHGIRMFCAGLLIGFVLGLAPWALADEHAAINMDYKEMTVRVFLQPNEEGLAGQLFPCPRGWSWQIYVLKEVERSGSHITWHPVQIEKGTCDAPR